jgi:hypothetical protein
VPREGRRRTGKFERVEVKPPERGRSVAEGLTELQRRRAAGEPPRGRQRQPAETYTAPDGSRIAVTAPGPGAPPPASQTAPGPLVLPLPPLLPLEAPPAAPAPAPAATPPAAAAAVQAPPTGEAGPRLAAGDPQQGVPIAIDGQTVSVPLGELVSGYLRQRDYSQKTQASAREMRIAQESQAAFNAARGNLEARLNQMLALDPDEFARPIDWVALSKTDPIGYSQKHARYLARQEMLAEQQRLAELRQREEAGRKQYALATGHQTLAQIIPGWTDPQTRQQLQARLLGQLRQRGFTEDEIARREMIDPREVIILLESSLWAAHAAQGAPQPQPTAARTLPGNGVMADGRGPDLTGLDDRFGRTRKLDDGLALLRARRALNG